MDKATQNHWDSVYKTKNSDEVSWTQDVPETSLNFIRSFGLPKSAKIIDIGGGDSKLADYLLDEGFENISVLDISSSALEKAKQRMGDRAAKINWIVSDITTFNPPTTYDVWHDRATFHFLTTDKQISTYLNVAKKSVTGFLIIGTFSEQGPEKCSGLSIKQYSEEKLTTALQHGFNKLRCITEDHITPFGTRQNFLFCGFKRKQK